MKKNIRFRVGRAPYRATVAVCLLAAACAAVETKFWQQADLSEFEKGNLSRLSMRSDGQLSLAPALKEVLDASIPYLWATAQDSKGNVYAGGGGPTGSTAQLFQIDAAGASKVLAEVEGLEIHAIAVDRQDRVYAATAPDGKVYRIAANGKSEIFYDPHAKYIWSMAFSAAGDLYIATGDRGDVHKVAPDGKGAVFFKTEETHARSLAIDKSGNLIVGTEPSGIVLRISPAGEGFVLYQSAKREITAVAVANDGSIYAAAVGIKGGPSTSSSSSTSSSPTPSAPAPASPGAPASSAPRPGTPAATTTSGPTISGGSEVYRIGTDGAPRKVWSQSTDIAYAIAFDPQQRPVIGTGNKGNIYRLDSDLRYTLLLNLAPTQVTSFGIGRKGELYAATGNIGKVYRIGPELEKQGTYESDTFDAGAFNYWGRLNYLGELSGGAVTFETRSGNVSHAHKNWSPWAPVALSGRGGRVSSPAARFVQYKLTMAAASDGKSPAIGAVDIAYLPKNLAPVVQEIETTPANYRFSTPVAIPLAVTASAATITLPSMTSSKRSSSSSGASLIDIGSSTSMQFAKGHMGARWLASDENGDSLLFKVEIRGVQESTWKLLRDKIRERYVSFDSAAYPDGRYVIRVTGSDAGSNPPDQALSAQLESDSFLVDNTPPQVIGLRGAVMGSQIEVTWKAKDALSIITKAEYSVNGGDWTVVEPVTKLSDSPELDYKLIIGRAAPGEYTVAVRVTDDFENQVVEKAVVR